MILSEKEKAQIIIDVVCKAMHITVREMMQKRREREYKDPRHWAMYFVRKETRLSLIQIGHIFGGRHHSTVISACNQIENLINFNGEKQTRADLEIDIFKRFAEVVPESWAASMASPLSNYLRPEEVAEYL